ncbi:MULTISPECIES: sigma-70 family RNA polymerase sigma factor [Lactobacillus]|jgi:RNA polymerase sporulation-specific sigma factor|uniref:Sigma-70 region 2 n=1 Tax=Lactobacillus amylolyticus DSM 11664 TaxID=585524 RepID=D4YT69_9LACO|nr:MULTISPECIES: sigma-70 family RNA polymerase sigma factor [Lactobacillus]ARD06410.1 hypothetical protein B1745_01555 [Lactobacillus amylolyticus]EFG55539.1 Sigma-70 region 2 [Lactobacillus amylolyticus DSM 11664]KRL19886.1 ComX [Lactobacillus amylolyticus DSM 11664]QFY05076.1 sigma-70 family RNA polymerase sigma factor [Lactobacillus amylolyticus]TDG60653.1 hypothetical protein C5L18_001451 [Lactobacillus amylolyticus]
MIHAKKEAKLISAARQDDEKALLQLFEKYRPLVVKSRRKFYFRDFDDDDWEQEALIVCLDAVDSYNPNRGKFGTFYKKRLYNRAVDLLRYRTTSRRIGNEIMLSLEALIECDSNKIIEPIEQPIATVANMENLADFFRNLSDPELVAMKVFLGHYTIEEAAEKYNMSIEKIKRAGQRAYQKLLKAVFDQVK